MASPSVKFPKTVLIVLCCLSVFVTVGFLLPFMVRFDNIVSDAAIRRYSEKSAYKHILIVTIDDSVLKKFGWPLPRRQYAYLIDKLVELGVKTIGFDVLFLEPSPSPQDDQLLVDATKKAGNVIHLGLVEMHQVAGLSEPIKTFRQPYGALGAGCYMLADPTTEDVLDPDGHIRRMRLFNLKSYYPSDTGCGNSSGCRNMPLASFSMANYSHYTGKPISELYPLYRDDNTRWLNFPRPVLREKSPGRPRRAGENKETLFTSYRYISMLDVLDGKLSDEEAQLLKGGLAMVGATAIGAYDHYPNPFSPMTPGVEFHASTLENLLNNDFLEFINPVWAILIALVFVWLPLTAFRASPYISALMTAFIFAGWTVLYIFLVKAGKRIDYIVPVTGLFASFLFVTLYRVIAEGKEKRWIKSTFGQYLSPKVVEAIVKDPSKLRLGGEKRDMTAFFLDIAHFTSISEKMDPETLTSFLNKYLSALTDIILKNEGVVDKYIGDCIMAFWNAPLDLKEHRRMGCLSAVECQEAITRLNAELIAGDMPEKPAIRIGLNSGHMVVGNMGSSTRFSYTVIGDEVNLASRLEGANKYFGSRIMASEATYSGAKDVIEARELGSIRVVGKQIPIKVYELMAKKSAIPDGIRRLTQAYTEGLSLYYARNFAKSAQAFRAALEAVPDDQPSKLYLKNCEEYIIRPPSADWDGVINITSK